MTDRTPLEPDALDRTLASLPGWGSEGDRLIKTFTFGSFREAMSFVVRIAFEAEDLDHHPELTNVYNQVTIALTTHSAGNRITAADAELARRIEAISWA
jgi:4a-hydroxytetrahydrobiopterin dehydratase